jgi:hypothetical protein
LRRRFVRAEVFRPGQTAYAGHGGEASRIPRPIEVEGGGKRLTLKCFGTLAFSIDRR